MRASLTCPYVDKLRREILQRETGLVFLDVSQATHPQIPGIPRRAEQIRGIRERAHIFSKTDTEHHVVSEASLQSSSIFGILVRISAVAGDKELYLGPAPKLLFPIGVLPLPREHSGFPSPRHRHSTLNTLPEMCYNAA